MAARRVPDSVRQLIEQQVDRLSATEQQVLEAAGVAGIAFTAAEVAVGLGQAMEDVDDACTSLARREQLLRAGRLEEAQALAVARAHQQQGRQAYALRLLGDIAARREPPEAAQAAAHYRHALTLSAELGMRPLQAHCHRGLGTLYATTGQQEQARAALSTAIKRYQTMEMTFWRPETEAALAQVDA